MRSFIAHVALFCLSFPALATDTTDVLKRWNGTLDVTASANCADESCDLSSVKIGTVSLAPSAKTVTTSQIFSKGYVVLEKLEHLLKDPAISCETRIREMNQLLSKIEVLHVDDLVILDYIRNHMGTYFSSPELRAQLASTLTRRTVSGTVFCQPSNKNCNFNPNAGILLSNSLILKEIETIKAMGQSTVNGFHQLNPSDQAEFVKKLSSHVGTLLSDQKLLNAESENFARACDKKVSKIFGKGNVHCTVSGYGIHSRTDKQPDGKYYVGSYDSAWDGRWHCYPDENGTYNINAELQLPKGGGETRKSLGCYNGQSFKISIAHERRVKGKILFGGTGGSLKEEGGLGYNLHTHLELVLLPMTPRKPGQDHNEWWHTQKHVDPVNVFCRGDCYPE